MTILRRASFVVLAAFALLGVLSGITWAASAAGLVHPLVVVSGSMEPGIPTGSLVMSLPKDVDEVAPGDVVTVTNPQNQVLVTHRVVTISQDEDTSWSLTLRGDANAGPDPREYAVPDGTSLPEPWLVIPAAGRLVETASRPVVAIPFLVGLASLVALASLPSSGGDGPRSGPSRSRTPQPEKTS